jgi:hypothetical protein
VKPAKIGLPIAEIIAIGTAKCDGDLAASTVHSSPNVKLEPADQLALRIAERARQAADHAESAFPFAHLQICYPRVHVLVEGKIGLVPLLPTTDSGRIPIRLAQAIPLVVDRATNPSELVIFVALEEGLWRSLSRQAGASMVTMAPSIAIMSSSAVAMVERDRTLALAVWRCAWGRHRSCAHRLYVASDDAALVELDSAAARSRTNGRSPARRMSHSSILRPVGCMSRSASPGWFSRSIRAPAQAPRSQPAPVLIRRRWCRRIGFTSSRPRTGARSSSRTRLLDEELRASATTRRGYPAAFRRNVWRWRLGDAPSVHFRSWPRPCENSI